MTDIVTGAAGQSPAGRTEVPFAYSNLSPRPRGRFVSLARLVLPGVARVDDQIGPYAAAWRRSNAQALGGDGPLWIVLGDSMSQGIGATAWNHGWVDQAAARLSADGLDHRIVNLSVSGARVADVLDRQLPALELLPEPALVTVLIGSNDVMRRTGREEFPDDVARMVEQLPQGSVIAPLTQPLRVARAANERIRAAEHAGHVVTTTVDPAPNGWRGLLADDHFHPNDAGYAVIADMFYQAIRRAR